MGSSTEAGLTQTTQNTPAWITADGNRTLAELPTDCIILGLNATIPWDNPRDLVSFEFVKSMEQIKMAVITPFLFLIGFPSNVVNMAVFYKQGLKDRINMCLFALAVADILNISFWLIWHAEGIYTTFADDEPYPSSYRFIMNNNVMGLIGFVYGPPLLSTVISTERCVCVLFPLRAKRCMPTKTLAVLISVALSIVIFLQFAVSSRYKTVCFYELLTNRKTWQIGAYYQDQLTEAVLVTLDGVFYGFVLSVGCPILVLITTTVTGIRLSQVVKWRRQAASSLTSTAMSSKEVGLTKMLICLSLEFFVLAIPNMVVRIVPLFQKEMVLGGLYNNTSGTIHCLHQICFYASSSVNFFVYYGTGTRFRQTLHAMTARGSRADKETPVLSSSVVLESPP